MIRYLIKNNLKLMLRNRWVMVAMILGPILVISVLSSAFEDLMKTYEKAEHFSVGYRIAEQSSMFAEHAESIREAGEEAGIVFVEYPEGEPEHLIRTNDLSGFVIFQGEEYTIYRSADHKTEGITLEYFINQIVSQAMEQIVQGEVVDEELPVKELSYMPAIDSKDYYGIVYIVYFIWCGIVCVAGVLSSEKKNEISKKFQVAPISGMGLFFAKWISCTVTVLVEISVSILICVWLFGTTWGNIGWSILILILAVFAANAFALFVYYLFDNLAVSIVAIFTSVWVMGFLGGSFETYMFSSFSEWMKLLSPIYHIDRTLVEYSCMGTSGFTGSCILYMLGIMVVCTTGALLVERIRRRRKA